jgi:DNA-binding LacI/PurR family transcriptional regulator/DNA-binding transcriptional regulator YhcF (GntR family)
MKSLEAYPSIRKAFDFVRENLEKGVWHPGERLPTVKSLAASIGISDRTMIKAVAILKAEGFVSSAKGGSIRVGSGELPAPKVPEPSTAVWMLKRSSLEKDILGGVYTQEGKLPSLKELQVRYGTCFTTMRKILRSMVADDVIHLRGKSYELHNALRGSAGRKVVFITNMLKNTPFSALNPHEYRVIETLEHECVRRETRLEVIEVNQNDSSSIQEAARGIADTNSVLGYILDVWGFSNEEIRLRYTELLSRFATLKKPVAIIDEGGDFVLPVQFSANPIFQVFRIEGKSAGGRMARLLLGLGHRSVAFISAYQSALWSSQRLDGVKEQFARAGLREGVHEFTADQMHEILPHVLCLSGFDDMLIRKILAVGRTKQQAHREFNAYVRLREGGYMHRFKPKELRALHDDLACLAGLVEGRTGRDLLETIWNDVLDAANVHVGSLFFEPLYKSALEITDITAWICVNDTTALLALPFLQNQGIDVPRDLSVVSFDNLVARAIEKRLTSFDFNTAGFVHRVLEFITRPPKPRGLYRHSPIEVEGAIMVRGTAAEPPPSSSSLPRSRPLR